jgi:hypothetical protein
MSRNGLILTALGGAAAAILIANYLNTDKGKQLLSSATDSLNDLTGKVAEFAKSNIANLKAEQEREVQQPS